MNKEPRRIHISDERAMLEKNKNKYKEIYVYDPDFLDEYKQSILNFLSSTPKLKSEVEKNMNEITEFVIADRVENGLSRLSCSQSQIHMDIQFANITENSFSLKEGNEYLNTYFVRELLHAGTRKKNLSGILELERDKEGKSTGKRKNTGLNAGIAQFLAEKITGEKVPDGIDTYAFNKHIVSLLEDTIGPGIMMASYFEDPNLLKRFMNNTAGNENYYEQFNKDLDTINKLQTTVQRIKNGSIKPKDPDSLLKMETVLKAQQDKLVESVFANVVIPNLQKQDETRRQENLLGVLFKYESLLQPVAKYVAKHENSDWVRYNILNAMRREINENGLNFEQIKEASNKIVETKKTSTVTANRYIADVDAFYNDNESVLKTERSTTITPLLKRQLTSMVIHLDGLEDINRRSGNEKSKESLDNYKTFIKRHFHKIDNLEEEIEKIREEQRNKITTTPKKDEILAKTRQMGTKEAEKAISSTNNATQKDTAKPQKDNGSSKTDKEQKEEKHPNLKDNFVIDNITGQVYSQQNKSIYEKAITITKATGKSVDLEDEALIELRENAVKKFRESLDKQEPNMVMVSVYGDKWKDVLVEAYLEGWNKGTAKVINEATQKGAELRTKTVENLKNGIMPQEEQRVVTLEEIKTVARELEVVENNNKTDVINRETKQPIFSERSKNIAIFADKWVKANPTDTFSQEAEETYQYIQEQVANNGGKVNPEEIIVNAQEQTESTKKTVVQLFNSNETQTEVNHFFEKQELTPEKLDTVKYVAPKKEIERPEVSEMPKKDVNIVCQKLEEATLEDVTEHLNMFNGKPILQEDGNYYHPFKEPIMAAKLNARYMELTGNDHPVFVQQAPYIIEGLMKDKEMLLSNNAYTNEYFDNIELIKKDIESRHPELVNDTSEIKTTQK